jgi:acyl homoserine lactone synthase
MEWSVLDGMFRLREEIFFQKLGWEVSSNGGLEQDNFDDLDPVYLIARNTKRRVSGCTRLMPTMGPYMLRDVFPELLQGEDAPADETTWELSRFTASPDRDNIQAGIGEVSLELMRSAVTFAEENGIKRYVAVTSASMERMLKRLGLPMRRLGEGKALRIGKVSTVACYIPIDGRTRAALMMPSRPEAQLREQEALLREVA